MNINKKMNKKRSSKEFGYLLLLPYFTLYFLFFFIPAISILPMSLMDWSIIGRPKFILFKNYLELFNNNTFPSISFWEWNCIFWFI